MPAICDRQLTRKGRLTRCYRTPGHDGACAPIPDSPAAAAEAITGRPSVSERVARPGNPNGLTLDEARRERDDAMTRADGGTDLAWQADVETAARQALAASPDGTVTADDLWHTGLRQPREPRALGPAMLRLVARGLLRRTGDYRPSTRRHATPIPVYTAGPQGLTRTARPTITATTGTPTP